MTVTHDHRQHLAELGLHVSDLLPAKRAILLVEGHHDELIPDELVGDDLGDIGDAIETGRGAVFRYASARAR